MLRLVTATLIFIAGISYFLAPAPIALRMFVSLAILAVLMLMAARIFSAVTKPHHHAKPVGKLTSDDLDLSFDDTSRPTSASNSREELDHSYFFFERPNTQRINSQH